MHTLWMQAAIKIAHGAPACVQESLCPSASGSHGSNVQVVHCNKTLILDRPAVRWQQQEAPGDTDAPKPQTINWTKTAELLTYENKSILHAQLRVGTTRQSSGELQW